MSRTYHPDKPSGSVAKFEHISAAHDCLDNQACRADFDEGATPNLNLSFTVKVNPVFAPNAMLPQIVSINLGVNGILALSTSPDPLPHIRSGHGPSWQRQRTILAQGRNRADLFPRTLSVPPFRGPHAFLPRLGLPQWPKSWMSSVPQWIDVYTSGVH